MKIEKKISSKREVFPSASRLLSLTPLYERLRLGFLSLAASRKKRESTLKRHLSRLQRAKAFAELYGLKDIALELDKETEKISNQLKVKGGAIWKKG